MTLLTIRDGDVHLASKIFMFLARQIKCIVVHRATIFAKDIISLHCRRAYDHKTLHEQAKNHPFLRHISFRIGPVNGQSKNRSFTYIR